MELNGSKLATPTRRSDLITAVLLFLFFSSLYFATASGITSSNDGSHYALARTILENGHFSLDRFDDYAEGNDIAIRDGVLYSDRPPGTAVAATLFYLLGGPLPDPLTALPSRHDAANPRLLYVLLLPAWSGAGVVVLLYLLLRRQQVSPAAAVIACLALGMGTAHWKYSTVLYSHALSAFLVMLAVSLALFLGRHPDSRWWRYALLGLVLGYGVLVEYSNGLMVLLVAGYVLLQLRPFTPRRLLQTILPMLLAGLLCAAFLAYYNSINFGGPFTLSYAYAVNYPWAGEFATTFSTPLLPGLRALLYFGEGGGWCGGPCYNQGLLLLSPVLLLALPGFYWYARRRGRECLLTSALFLIYLFLFAKHHTAHGFTGDGRYLVPFLGLLALPLGHFLHWLFAQKRRGWVLVLETAVYALLFLSMRNIFLHIGFSYNYALDLSQLDPMIANPRNWRYLSGQVWRNGGNLPLLWLIEVFLLLIFLGGRQLSRRRT